MTDLDQYQPPGQEQEHPAVSRRGFFGTAGGLAGAAVAGSVLSGAGAASAATTDADGAPAAAASPLQTLDDLMAGNRRWVLGTSEHPHQSIARREEVAGHQEPPAVVLSCIDSRVPPELVFDVGLGDMFVIRTGAQVIDAGVVLGSIEFGPEVYPSARLILVLGHSGCGAVQGAIKSIQSGVPAPGHIQHVVSALRPAYDVAIRETGDLEGNMIRAQTRLTVGRLAADPLLREHIVSGDLLIAGGFYQLETGVVTLLR